MAGVLDVVWRQKADDLVEDDKFWGFCYLGINVVQAVFRMLWTDQWFSCVIGRRTLELDGSSLGTTT